MYMCWLVRRRIILRVSDSLFPKWMRDTLGSLGVKNSSCGRGSRGGEMGEFSSPFFWAPFFLSFFLSLKYWNNIWFLWHYYKNSPPPPISSLDPPLRGTPKWFRRRVRMAKHQCDRLAHTMGRGHERQERWGWHRSSRRGRLMGLSMQGVKASFKGPLMGCTNFSWCPCSLNSINGWRQQGLDCLHT